MGNGGGGSGGFLGFNVAAAEGTRSKHHHDQCLFMMRVSGENLFGMSHFLRVQVRKDGRNLAADLVCCLMFLFLYVCLDGFRIRSRRSSRGDQSDRFHEQHLR